MLMDPMGGIVMTNDGNAILREVCCLKHCKHKCTGFVNYLSHLSDTSVILVVF